MCLLIHVFNKLVQELDKIATQIKTFEIATQIKTFEKTQNMSQNPYQFELVY